MEFIFQLLVLPAIGIFVFWCIGSIYSKTNWHKGAVQTGDRDWVKINDTRRTEGVFAPGWKKGEAAEPFSQMYTVIDGRTMYVFQRWCVHKVVYHQSWPSRLGFGNPFDDRQHDILEGVTVAKNSEGNWHIVPKADELLETQMLPVAKDGE